MRQLKFHERKLLRKVDFLQWKRSSNVKELTIMRRYSLSKREEYVRYNRLAGMVTKLVSRLRKLDARDPFRVEMTENLLQKLYAMGVIATTKSLLTAERITASAFCRRRLSICLVRLKMAERVRDAIEFIEGGHIRVGPEVVTDPAFLVTRSMEDYVTWVDSSKIRRKVLEYNDRLDDFDLLGA